MDTCPLDNNNQITHRDKPEEIYGNGIPSCGELKDMITYYSNTISWSLVYFLLIIVMTKDVLDFGWNIYFKRTESKNKKEAALKMGYVNEEDVKMNVVKEEMQEECTNGEQNPLLPK